MRLSALVLVIAELLGAAPAAAVDRLVDADLLPCISGGLPIHATIGDAVNAAVEGETILVCAGDYPEIVMILTPGLTLRAQGLVRVTSFIATAPRTTIHRFEISGSDSCGVSVDASRAHIHGNRVHDNGGGICVSGGGGHEIDHNLVERNGVGISFDASSGEVSNNITRDNGFRNITGSECLGGSLTIRRNLASGNGIFVGHECGAVIADNIVHDAPTPGISVFAATAVLVTHNLVQHADVGVHVEHVKGATVSFNSVNFTTVGIDLDSSTDVTVTRNNVSRSTVVDCRWDGFGVNELAGNNCGTQIPAGAFE